MNISWERFRVNLTDEFGNQNMQLFYRAWMPDAAYAGKGYGATADEAITDVLRRHEGISA